MPSIVGSGVFGWPREGSGASPSQAQNIYGVLPATTTWLRAKYVWAWCADVSAWVPVWAGTVDAPPAATAAWVQPTNVTVTWTVPAISAATTWTVKRSDGSVVGTVAVSVLSLVDTSPLLTSSASGNKTLGAYTVTGSDGVLTSSPTATSTVTWNLDASTFALAVTLTGTTATITTSWTHNVTYGRPDRWGLWDSLTALWITQAVDGAATSLDLTGQLRGRQRTFRIVPFTLSPDGVTYVQSGNLADFSIGVPQNEPPHVSSTRSPSATIIQQWAHPVNSEGRTGYLFQVSYDGVNFANATGLAQPMGVNVTQIVESVTQNVPVWTRIRTEGAGGPSPFRTVYYPG